MDWVYKSDEENRKFAEGHLGTSLDDFKTAENVAVELGFKVSVTRIFENFMVTFSHPVLKHPKKIERYDNEWSAVGKSPLSAIYRCFAHLYSYKDQK